jgi:dephospho-CoA kinase
MASTKKPVIGLTGGIASGKSVASRVLAGLGIGIVDADRIAREVVAPGSDGLAAVVAAFGSEVLTEDGALDREKVAARVFREPDARKVLQAITHPRIAVRSAELLAELSATDSPYVVYDAPLLVEVGAHKGLDALIVVAAERATQIARAVARDGMTPDEAERRIAAQLPLAEKVAVADYVVHNDGTLEALEAAVLDTHRRILARFGLGNPQGGRS